MYSILQKFSNKVLLLSLCFLLYASSMDSSPWMRSIYNNKAGHRLTVPLQLLWQALALEAVQMPASIHLHWNNPVWMILGLQLCREHSFTPKMEAEAPKLQNLPTSLHSDPYWKTDMSKS